MASEEGAADCPSPEGEAQESPAPEPMLYYYALPAGMQLPSINASGISRVMASEEGAADGPSPEGEVQESPAPEPMLYYYTMPAGMQLPSINASGISRVMASEEGAADGPSPEGEVQESPAPEPMLYYYALPAGMQLPSINASGISRVYQVGMVGNSERPNPLQNGVSPWPLEPPGSPGSPGPPGSCGKVTLHRDCKALGIIVADPKPLMQALVIINIEVDSEVTTWNLQHPYHQIQPGMAILSVNGLTDPHEMKVELNSAETLEIYLKDQLTQVETRHFRESLQQYQIQGCSHLFQKVTTEEVEPCSICHEDMDTSSHEVIRLVNCMHHFHPGCVAQWIASVEDPRCPLCCTKLSDHKIWGIKLSAREYPFLSQWGLMAFCLRFLQESKVGFHLHPGRLTWNLQITHLERKMIFQASLIMFHVYLPGCNACQLDFL